MLNEFEVKVLECLVEIKEKVKSMEHLSLISLANSGSEVSSKVANNIITDRIVDKFMDYSNKLPRMPR